MYRLLRNSEAALSFDQPPQPGPCGGARLVTLAASGLKITSASDLTDAAQKIVAAVKAA
jgi:hypothetical protein